MITLNYTLKHIIAVGTYIYAWRLVRRTFTMFGVATKLKTKLNFVFTTLLLKHLRVIKTRSVLRVITEYDVSLLHV